MRKRIRTLWPWLALLTLALAAWPLGRAWAAAPAQDEPPMGDKVLFGTNFVLRRGETLHGDLVLFGGSVTLEPESQVVGDVVVMGGTLKADGDILGQAVVLGGTAEVNARVNNDLVVIGGGVRLGSKAWVGGDLVVTGGGLTRAPGAQVAGRIVQNATVEFGPWTGPSMGNPWLWTFWHGVTRALWALAEALLMAALAGLTALFAPQALQRVGETAQQYPLHAGGVGLLGAVLAAVLAVILAVSILGLPLALALVLVAGLAYLMGLMGLGWLLGHRLAQALKRTWAPVVEAALGTLLLMLVLAALDMLTCLGWVAHIVVVALGFGAALLTLLGSQEPETALQRLGVRG